MMPQTTIQETRTPARLPTVWIERLPGLAGTSPVDVAEAFRDMPGLALLESARPGRAARWSFLSADPVDVLEAPSDGPDPFAGARSLVGCMAAATPGTDGDPADAPPFLGGLVVVLAYELGRRFERLPSTSPLDQDLPLLRAALHDWVVAWDRASGAIWLGGRAVDGDAGRLAERLAGVRARLADLAPRRPLVPAAEPPRELRFISGINRPTYEAGVDAIRDAIARGHIYQANLTRRLESPFAGDPWPLYRRLRVGDPALFAAFLDVGPSAATGVSGERARPAAHGATRAPRAILSASPEPFLAVTPDGLVSTDPIKGTRPRGRTPADDRRLARELLASAKDRAENVMIVDVLRNDLGRVCRPGSVRVPRLCRLERTAAVQHLVSTVTGRLSPGRDAFDLLAAAFPGGSITGAPKIRAMAILDGLEPIGRGPYSGALGWLGPDGAMRTSILIRTFVADGTRLSLHVGGGITWHSDPAAEWEETVAKARGPLGAIGGEVVGG